MAFLRFGIIPNLPIALPGEFQSRLVSNAADGMAISHPEFHSHEYLLLICSSDSKHEYEADYAKNIEMVGMFNYFGKDTNV